MREHLIVLEPVSQHHERGLKRSPGNRQLLQITIHVSVRGPEMRPGDTREHAGLSAAADWCVLTTARRFPGHRREGLS